MDESIFRRPHLRTSTRVCVAVGNLYVAKLRVEKWIAPIIVLSAVLSGILFGASYWLLPAMEILAVGIAHLVSHGAMCVYISARWITGSRR